MYKLFTSESVGKGHPDKICDQISDLILDKVLSADPHARVAIECMASNRLIVIGGELTTSAYVDIVASAWEVLFALGYHEKDFTITSNVNEQSPDITMGVSQTNGLLGAGDQGIVFGYATNATPEYMPLPIVLAHELARKSHELVFSGKFKQAKFDLKTQVTVNYESWDEPRIELMLMSIQHEEDYDKEKFNQFIREELMLPIAKNRGLNTDFKVLINPTGRFTIGGPIADTGLTGRKIIVDSYGGWAHHGGGAFSGKDATKPDRSGAYAARWIAKNIIAAGLARQIEIQIAYAIGVTDPVAIGIETFGTELVSINAIERAIRDVFDLSINGVIKHLKLREPIYANTAAFGHFGRTDIDLPWERLDKVDALRCLLEIDA